MMKTTRLTGQILMILLLFTAGFTLNAQEKEEDLKKIREQQMIERKKMLEEQQEQVKVIQKEAAERQKELEIQAREAARAPRPPSVSGFFYGSDGEPFVITSDQRNQSQLTLRKNFNGNTDTSSGEFDVEDGVRQFRCVINGNVRSGAITIKLEYPDGKVFKDLTINSSADISFSQSMSFKEGEAKNYIGAWKYVIEADKAEGNYMLQIMTN
jgi:hypothetical protein